jgi:hypothetical protein
LPDKSDPEALIILQRMAINGDTNFQDTADDLLRQGRITNSDYTGRINEAQQWRKPVMKEVDGIIRAKTGYSELNPNPNAGNSYIMAHRDVLEWLDSDKGKNSSDDEKIKMAERIGNIYTLNARQNAIFSYRPLNFVMTDGKPNFDEMYIRTEKDRVSGVLSDEQYKRDLIRIEEMEEEFNEIYEIKNHPQKTEGNRR